MTWVVLVVLLLLVGSVLLAIEVFVIPGFGAVGITGVAAMVLAGVLAWAKLDTSAAGMALGLGLGASALTLWLVPKTALARGVILTSQGEGVAPKEQGALLGLIGVALTPLRPAGTARIGGRSFDVLSSGAYVEPGTPVRVIRVEGPAVVVEPVDSNNN